LQHLTPRNQDQQESHRLLTPSYGDHNKRKDKQETKT